MFFNTVNSNIWYVSDDGSDENDCHSPTVPCRNLQTVLNRAKDDADIYVTSPKLSVDKVYRNVTFILSKLSNKESLFGLSCIIESGISFRLSSPFYSTIHLSCSGNEIEVFTSFINTIYMLWYLQATCPLPPPFFTKFQHMVAMAATHTISAL